MSLLILDASSSTGLASWRWALDNLPPGRRDMHFLPEYVEAYARQAGGRAVAALWRGTAGSEFFVLQPFVLSNGSLASPYGYGGPVAAHVDGRGADGYLAAIAAWAREEGVASEWCRLHPFIAEHQQFVLMKGAQPRRDDVVRVETEKPVAWVSLSLANDVEGELRKGHKAKVALARRSGVAVVESGDVDWFHRVYTETMRRHDASQKWFFPPEFLWGLAAPFNVPRAGDDRSMRKATLLIAHRRGVPEVGALILGAYSTAWYHYAGRILVEPDVGAGNLLVVEAAHWARRAGYSRLHLGGGTTTSLDDPLLRFKGGFSDQRTLTQVYRRRF